MFKWAWRALAGGRNSAAARDPLGSALGRLEREVMDIVWRSGAVNVREALAQLPKPAAYTTVMTTLDRLFKKGLLERERAGRAFVYRAALSRQEVEAAVASGLLLGLLETGAGGARPVLSNLVDVIGDRDDALLDELEELVREKRRQNRQG
jgi:predicted transcriptional regulator